MKKLIVIPLIIFALVVMLVLWANTLTTKKEFEAKIKAIIDEAEGEPPERLSSQEIAQLPQPVQRYFNYAKILDKPLIKSVRLQQGGKFRMDAAQAWKTLEAEQFYVTRIPRYIWRGRIEVAPLVPVEGLDEYLAGKGKLTIKLWSILAVAGESGPAADQAELMRYLSEMPWFPMSFLQKGLVEWTAIDDHSATATLRDNGLEVSGVFYFDDLGRPVRFTADRYRNSDAMAKWEGEFARFAQRNGVMLPTYGGVAWKLPEGDLTYARLTITDVDYTYYPAE